MSRFKSIYGSFSDRKRCRFGRPGLIPIVFISKTLVALHDVNAVLEVLKLGRSHVRKLYKSPSFLQQCVILGDDGLLTKYEHTITYSWFTLSN
jgi:hypothetical protein